MYENNFMITEQLSHCWSIQNTLESTLLLYTGLQPCSSIKYVDDWTQQHSEEEFQHADLECLGHSSDKESKYIGHLLL